jgi:hypothetical protein
MGADLTGAEIVLVGVEVDFTSGTFSVFSFNVQHPGSLKFNTPEIQIRRDELDPQIPPVRPLHALMDDHCLRRLPRSQIGHAQTLLQFELSRAHQQAAVIVHHSGETGFKLQRACPAIPLDCYWNA